MDCRACGRPLSSAKRDCQACGEDNGFPNVRLAQDSRETTALAARLHEAEVSTTARNCRDVLERFGTAVLDSKAVIARPLGVLDSLLESDKRNYASFAKELRAGTRVPEENKFDRIRTQFESALFPNFHEEILFGSLSLGAGGVLAYGSYAIVLRTEYIKSRATVFEENPYTFAQKHHLRLTDTIPFGYRATWGDRDMLAKAKVHAQLTDKTKDTEFPGLLLRDAGRTDTGDFIEVHVYGPINQYTIERVACKTPKNAADRAILKRMERRLIKVGAALEMT